jgi:putative ABC transport system permease protein
MNPLLPLLLAWRRLAGHGLQSLVTVLGVALGLAVAAAIMIVDHHSTERRIASSALVDLSRAVPAAIRRPAEPPTRILRVSFERGAHQQVRPFEPRDLLPTQEGAAADGVSAERPPAKRGEEDYQAMRLAVRLASLMAFSVGAVIVFYSMRYSVASRGRELMLLLCLGQGRRGLGMSLFAEAVMLGLAGTLIGLVAGWWFGLMLLDAGISTTGRKPVSDGTLPVLELAVLAGLSLSVALLGVLGPLRTLLRMQPADVLQPRFLTERTPRVGVDGRGMAWLLPILMIGTWLAVRPFVEGWLSVIQFFLMESAVVAVIALAMLWWMPPVLRGAIRLSEHLFSSVLPLESLLAGRRMRLVGRELVFTIASVALVFGMLIALDGLTRSLKDEITAWGGRALTPNVFMKRYGGHRPPIDEALEALRQRGLLPVRLSRKVEGEIPIRLVHGGDAAPLFDELGLPRLSAERLMVSRTLASRFDLDTGDRVLIDTETERHRFLVAAVTDRVGFFAEDGQYVDLKSWFLFSAEAPLFADNLALTVGERLVVRGLNGAAPTDAQLRPIARHYRSVGSGSERQRWQTSEIDRDFAIFDFIVAMTTLLAAVGVANTLLIQVLARSRELSLLRTLGVSRSQTLRLLLVEGGLIGAVGGLFALLLGHLFALIGVGFLDRFTLFEYSLSFSPVHALSVLLLAVLTCSAAALYPAFVAQRLSSAESLHYE